MIDFHHEKMKLKLELAEVTFLEIVLETFARGLINTNKTVCLYKST